MKERGSLRWLGTLEENEQRGKERKRVLERVVCHMPQNSILGFREVLRVEVRFLADKLVYCFQKTFF